MYGVSVWHELSVMCDSLIGGTCFGVMASIFNKKSRIYGTSDLSDLSIELAMASHCVRGSATSLIGSDRSHDKMWEAVCKRVQNLSKSASHGLPWPPTDALTLFPVI